MTTASPPTTKEVTVAGERLWVTSPAPRDAWNEILADDPLALVTQSPGWLDARCRLGGYEDASRLYQRENGRRLVLPMVRRRALAGWLAIQSSFGEGWSMGGPLAPGGIVGGDIAVISGDVIAQRTLRTLIRPNPLLAAEWAGVVAHSARAVPRLAHVLDLAGGFEEVWSRFRPGARTSVHKAEKAGVTIERGSSREHVAAFYGLLEQSRERWAARQLEPAWLTRVRGRRLDPLRKFQLLAETLGEAFGIWLARLDDRPVAAAIVLRGRNAHYTRGAMDAPAAGPTAANYLLQAAAIRDACEAGCRHYHLGETGGSESLAFFKTRFGAEAHPYAEYRFESLPLTSVDRMLRNAVKRVIGFTDPE